MTTRTQAARATADQADATLRRLDFTLSAREASPAPVRDEDGWVPGDPLYPMPRGWFYGEQCVRPMVELLDDYPHKMRCEPCGVSWTGDDPCWMCGTDRPPLSPMAIVQ